MFHAISLLCPADVRGKSAGILSLDRSLVPSFPWRTEARLRGARSPLNVEISAKIPLQDFLVSANIPTGLGCAGLC